MIKLLVIDDDKSLCRPIKNFFESKNYHVCLAHNGKEGLDYIKKNNPHLVFLDIGLPDISGLDVLEKIQEMENHTKVIMITAYDTLDKIEKARKLGASEYIKKPFTLEYLQEKGMQKVQKELFEELRREHEREFRLRNMFQKYVPENVVNEVFSRDLTPEELFQGVKLKVSVLMSDIRNFCSLSERLNPRELVRMLNSYFKHVVKPIYSNGGIVDKFIGDGIMGVFGITGSNINGNDAENAVRAAWQMTKNLKDFNEKNRHKYGDVVIGIAINTGEAVAGNVGCDNKLEYTVIGDVVNISTKMENLTREYPNGLIISEATLREAASIVEAENLGRILPVKENEEVYYVRNVKMQEMAPQKA